MFQFHSFICSCPVFPALFTEVKSCTQDGSVATAGLRAASAFEKLPRGSRYQATARTGCILKSTRQPDTPPTWEAVPTPRPWHFRAVPAQSEIPQAFWGSWLFPLREYLKWCPGGADNTKATHNNSFMRPHAERAFSSTLECTWSSGPGRW